MCVCHSLRLAGYMHVAGLALHIDIDQIATNTRKATRPPLRYTRTEFLPLFEELAKKGQKCKIHTNAQI